MAFRILRVIIDDATDARLQAISKERFTAVDDLAAAAISEAALDYFRNRKDDPGRTALASEGGNRT